MEIERKFLTKNIPFDITVFPKNEISQCYIALDPTIRLRKSNKKYFLTVKGKGSIAHEEFEMEISEKQYLNLLKKSDTENLIKTRYFIPIDGGLTAETDIYHGFLEGLITTEVEFESLDKAESFNPPEWFGKDISFDLRYKNSSLIINGMPEN